MNRKEGISDSPSASCESAPAAGQSGRATRRHNNATIFLSLIAVAGLVALYLLSSKLFHETSDIDLPSPHSIPSESPVNGNAMMVPSPNSPSSDTDNPAKDGWPTEVFHNQASAQLKQLGKLIVHSEDLDLRKIASVAVDDVVCGELYPADREVVFKDKLFRVERAYGKKLPQTLNQAASFAGHVGLTAAIRALAAPFQTATDVRCKFKLFRVNIVEQEIETQLYFEISGRTSTGMIQQNATWDMQWAAGVDENPPRISRIAVTDFEQVVSQQKTGPLFSECTEAVLGNVACYQPQLMIGLNEILEFSQQRRYYYSLGTPGVAISDVNGDGLEDLYLCQEEGLPNRLFLQQQDGTVSDVSADWKVDWLHDSRSALFFDWDNDGDQDLAVAVLGGVVLAENDNQQRFLFRTVLASSEDTMSLCGTDFDADGDLDLYVCAYYTNASPGADESTTPAATEQFVMHDANNGGSNSLFRNDGTGTFEEVTTEIGLDENNQRFSFAAAWEDYDDDGDFDLYVANDYGRDNFYRNDGGHFLDVAKTANVEDSAGGMGIAWCDYNRDGLMDVFISNMWSAAGNRISFQPQFKASAPAEVKRRLQRYVRGNTLMQGSPDGVFRHVSAEAAVEMGRWAWSPAFVDINNDGWDDLFVANGMVTTPDTRDL